MHVRDRSRAAADSCVIFRATGAAEHDHAELGLRHDRDLKGYTLYRASSPGGTFTKLNATLLSKTATQYVDNAAPNNMTSYYQIEALDTSNNVSSRASSSAVRGTQPSTNAEPNAEPVAEPNAEPVAEPDAEPVTEPDAECESVGVSDRRPIADPHIRIAAAAGDAAA